MSPSPRLLTVVLNFRTAEMTLRSVAAARRAMAGLNGEIIVVDNASGDGSFEQMHAEAQAQGWSQDGSVRIVEAGRNGGFGAGNNFGILSGMSDGGAPDFIYVLNSDAFPAADAIAKLRDHLQQNPKTGIVGSYIHGEDGTPHLSTFRFPSIASEFEGAIRFGPVSRLLAAKRVPIEIPATSRQVDWLAGASMMIRRTVLDQIGLFDETFFLYFEETDLCLRAHRAGWETTYVHNSHVAHIGSVSTGMKKWHRVPDYWFDSRFYYFAKNHGVFTATLATLAHVIGGLLHRLRQVINGRKPVDPPHFLRTLLRHDIFALFQRRCTPNVPRLSEAPVLISE